MKLAFGLFLAALGAASGASPALPGEIEGGPPGDYARLSASARLGITYNAEVKGLGNTAVPVRSDDLVVLPRFLVKERRMTLTQTDVLTDKGRLEMAEDVYLSPLYRAAFGPLMQLAEYYFNPFSIFRGWHPNEAEAMTLYRQDMRLKKLAEIDSLIGLEMIDNANDAKEYQRIRFDAALSTR